MLFHASIPADDPALAAGVLANLTRGRSFPFPSVPGGFVVFCGEGGGHLLEVYPSGAALKPTRTGAVTEAVEPAELNEVHLALGVPLSRAEVEAVLTRAGWSGRVCDRGGVFQVIELWIDNRFLIELLTPEMQAAYTAAMTPEKWKAYLGLRAAA